MNYDLDLTEADVVMFLQSFIDSLYVLIMSIFA